MNKIKIVGALIFILALILALISMDIANENRKNITTLSSITEQKALIEEISKSIFYSYRNGVTDPKALDKSIRKSVRLEENSSAPIQELWHNFYDDVKRFRSQQKIATGYNPIITAKLVNRIYHNNVLLVRAFDKQLNIKRVSRQQNIEAYKKLQNTLFFILIILLFYLFTQLHLIFEFIQKFSKTSKKIIKNSTIQGIELINIEAKNYELKEATENYNYMVKKMNLSIIKSSDSMVESIKSLEDVAQNIENFMELLSTMQEKESDELFQKEDAVIDSLETLMRLRKRLKDLKVALDNLTT